MHPVYDTRTTQPTAVDSHDLKRALAAATLSIALAGIVLAAASFLTSQPATTADSSAASASEIRDGWSSYLGAAAAQSDRPVIDGWSSYLLVPELDPASVRDGWSSYLLAPELDPASVRDGWSSYLLAAELDPASVRDGWSSYLLAGQSNAPGE
jgi:hypothetical protein